MHVIEADGSTLIAVRRTGLTPEQKRALALFDNRTAELSEWNADAIADDKAHGLELAPFFTDGELSKLLGPASTAKVKSVQTGDVADRFWISIRGPLKQQAYALQRVRDLLAELADVEVEIGSVQQDAAALEAWGTK